MTSLPLSRCRHQGACEADREGCVGQGASLCAEGLACPALHQPPSQPQCAAQGCVWLLHLQRRWQRVPTQLPRGGMMSADRKDWYYYYYFYCWETLTMNYYPLPLSLSPLPTWLLWSLSVCFCLSFSLLYPHPLPSIYCTLPAHGHRGRCPVQAPYREGSCHPPDPWGGGLPAATPGGLPHQQQTLHRGGLTELTRSLSCMHSTYLY